MRVYKRHFLKETKVSTNKKGDRLLFWLVLYYAGVRLRKRDGLLFLVGVILHRSKKCQISALKMPKVSLFQDKVACPLFYTDPIRSGDGFFCRLPGVALN
jgi:hypothetical protein